MRYRLNRNPGSFLTVFGLFWFGVCHPQFGRADELRAFWVDTFHAAMRNTAEVSQLVSDARAGNFNAVIVEVRKRGAGYSRVLQDWRGWLEEGILDLNIPMAYFRHEQNAGDWANWSRFAKENRSGRHLALGVGAYLNTISNTLVQMNSVRQGTASALPSEGVVCYSYAAPVKDAVLRNEFLEALTGPSSHHPNTPALFPTPVNPPAMPWKSPTGPALLMGYVRDAQTGQPLDGVTIEVCDATRTFYRLEVDL